MFTVKIKKVHQKYAELFPLGSIVTVRRYDDNAVRLQVLSEVDHTWYSAEDMCKAFSNTCTYSDIFDKIQEKVYLSDDQRLQIAQANVIRYTHLIDIGCDYKYYSDLLKNAEQKLVELKTIQDA